MSASRLREGLASGWLVAAAATWSPMASAQLEPVTIYPAKKVITMERASPEASAVAVAGTRVLMVGSVDSIKKSLGDRPATVDATFSDKIVMPGFIDQHMHPLLAATTLNTEIIATEDWDLPERTYKAANTPAEYRSRLQAASDGLKDPKEWLFSWGWQPLWHGKITRKDLDEISTTRPIMVWHRSCHEFVFNTAAIQLMALDESTMKGKGLPSTQYNWDNGHWWENGADTFVLGPLFKHMGTPARLVAGLKIMTAMLHAKGVTAYNEPGTLLPQLVWPLYQKVLGDPAVPFYSFFFPDARTQVNRGLGLPESLADAEKQVAMGPAGKVSMFPKQIKLFADGAIVSQAMQMMGGFTDGHQGEWMMSPETLEERGKLYWDAGYQLHIHITGDLGLEKVLDMLERRMKENPRKDHRTVIVHFANSTEAQVERIAKLGAIVSANPYYPVGFADKFGQFGLGQPRADTMVRAASVIRRGIPYSLHSDVPIAPPDPLFLAWSAVNRQTWSGRVAAPEQRIGVDDALRGITIEAAYSWQREKDLGSIAPGKVANFTILEQDPYAVEPIRLKDIPIWGTVFEGRLFPSKLAPKKVAQTEVQPAFAQPFDVGVHGHPSGDSCGISRQLVLALERALRESAEPRLDAAKVSVATLQ